MKVTVECNESEKKSGGGPDPLTLHATTSKIRTNSLRVEGLRQKRSEVGTEGEP